MRKFLMLAVATVVGCLAMVDVALAAEVVAVESDWLVRLQEYYMIASAVIGTAAMIAAITPSPRDNQVVGVLRRIIDFIGFNFGFAKNKD